MGNGEGGEKGEGGGEGELANTQQSMMSEACFSLLLMLEMN